MKIINLNHTVWSHVSHNPEIRKRIILSEGELPGITTLSQAVFQPGDRAAGHAHTDMSEVFLVAAGEGVIRLNGREYPLNSDIVAVAEPNDVHEIENTGDTPLILTYFGVRIPRSAGLHPLKSCEAGVGIETVSTAFRRI